MDGVEIFQSGPVGEEGGELVEDGLGHAEERIDEGGNGCCFGRGIAGYCRLNKVEADGGGIELLAFVSITRII